jgi:hypothetical protein
MAGKNRWSLSGTRRPVNQALIYTKFISIIEEEAEFWDTHSTADYEVEFKPIKVRLAKNLSQGITIRLDEDTLAELRIWLTTKE